MARRPKGVHATAQQESTRLLLAAEYHELSRRRRTKYVPFSTSTHSVEPENGDASHLRICC